MKNKGLIIGIVVALAVGAGGFFAGTQYQKSKAESFTGERGNFSRSQFNQGEHQLGQDDGFRGRFSGQGQPVSGEIIAKDDESITIKLQDGGSKIVFMSDETSIRKTEEGNKDDLISEAQVMVFGSENDDGSFTATNIQIGSGFRGRLDQGIHDNQE